MVSGPEAGPEKPPETAQAPTESKELTGEELYMNSCAPCHGVKGDGAGPAARFLYPKPRNFGNRKFRLVTTGNRVPSEADLMYVVERGMPGSAMFPFAHLAESDRQKLVTYVRQLTRAAAFEQATHDAEANTDPADLAAIVDQALTPQAAIGVPSDLPPYSPESVARGALLYQKGTCVSCHGKTGKGDGVQDQRDEVGAPIRPRDLTRGIFKGGRALRQLYARIYLGMPGTPMPSNADLKPAEIGDLINFVLSLSPPDTQEQVEQRRTKLTARRSLVPLGDDISEKAWHAAPSVHLVVSPLWWRDYPEPDLHVQALHDGKTLALRLVWQDESRNDQPVRPQDFEDMAAVQLFKGSREPFLGMGALDHAVDVWLWRAGWQGKAATFADVDTAYPNMAIDLYPFEKAGDGKRPHAPELQPPEFLTARAAGNLRADPSQSFTGNNLQAKGFGTLTMRPRVNQRVSARGEWKEGRWTVALRRSLAVDPDQGVDLKAGDKLSIAFALWDGAARDRNGQKLVSIWHELLLE
jgi:mono/diheme cytochrome c family protein